MDIHQFGYTLNIFLNKYEDILLEEHYEELREHLKFLKLFKNSTQIETKNYGYHWDICPYTSEEATSLPETCPCCSTEKYMIACSRLMNLYKRIKNK